MAVENHNQVIILGDMNFRINTMDRAEVISTIEKGNI
jgi:hypothetical protein